MTESSLVTAHPEWLDCGKALHYDMLEVSLDPRASSMRLTTEDTLKGVDSGPANGVCTWERHEEKPGMTSDSTRLCA